MAQTAAHSVDQVVPHVPVCQWVLALPIPLRPLLAAQPKLPTPVLQVAADVLHACGPPRRAEAGEDLGA